ncbi:ArsR/SmtB family transcription factor [Paeniglutamicibacter cryotolerans]|uniref:ArsR family transcriptional regulator n=1 Tax=Paeniglutamicibacter cryotolerans TaxID=670079 RepID=A0A839QDE9_9MICC|nr:metalloregulator ArsR/SmtB family transcription factor [Paeniglutamicibacter cryotolerans]MBB2994208.1 ArsR family transcriptional regulator [Paeniglutamicibacter cryotolerans]
MVHDDIFTALADPTRRLLLEALKPGERSVGSLVDQLGVSQPTVSKHLKVLREASLVAMRADGQRRYYALALPALALAADWAGSFLPAAAPPTPAPVRAPAQGSPARVQAPGASAAGSTSAIVPVRIPITELEPASAGAQASAAAQQLGRTVGRTVEQVTGRAADLLERLPMPKFGRRR